MNVTSRRRPGTIRTSSGRVDLYYITSNGRSAAVTGPTSESEEGGAPRNGAPSRGCVASEAIIRAHAHKVKLEVDGSDLIGEGNASNGILTSKIDVQIFEL